MNVLITYYDFQEPGGVANYYKSLQGKFNMPIQHFIIGKRPKEKGYLSLIFRMLRDYFKFIKYLKNNPISLVHLNPSLNWRSFIRDGIFIFLAKIIKKKVVVFFRGWEKSFEINIERNFLWLFKLLYGKSDAFIVLCDEFNRTLKRWGIVQPIYNEVTVINEEDLIGFDIQSALKKRQDSENWRVLFLSRIVREKGIYETIEAVSLLQYKYPKLELIIAGDGDELEKVKSFVIDHNVKNVTFTGHIMAKEKRQIFENAHIFCFPTTYGEGMPNSVIEAMAFGLPIVTRPVGGIKDFFKNTEHGFISTSLNPVIFADMIEKLILENELYGKISLSNYQYAQSHFLAYNAVLRLELIYKKILRSQNLFSINPK